MGGILFLLLYSLLLGVIHGITPDEHTWPITFSYAIGAFSTKKGIFVAFLFTLAFTFQRAIASEIVYLAIINVKAFYSINGYIYTIVGIVMLVAGVYVLNKHSILHLDFFPASWLGKKHTHDMEEYPKDIISLTNIFSNSTFESVIAENSLRKISKIKDIDYKYLKKISAKIFALSIVSFISDYKSASVLFQGSFICKDKEYRDRVISIIKANYKGHIHIDYDNLSDIKGASLI